MVARAMPLASAVNTTVAFDTSKCFSNSSAMAAMSFVSTRWFKKPSTLMMFPGSTLPSLRIRSLRRSIPFTYPPHKKI
jgi:hypothetical protein